MATHGIDDPHHLRINEVKLDLNVPFLELKKNLPPGVFLHYSRLYGHGLIFANLNLGYLRHKTQLKLNFITFKAHIDLSEAQFMNGQEYGVIDMHEVSGRLRNPNHLSVPLFKWKIKGHIHELFKVENNNILAIFLTFNPNRNLYQEDFFPGFTSTSRKKAIQHIKDYTIDSIIIKGEQSLNPIVYELMKSELNVEATEYITADHHNHLSIQKCKAPLQPFNLENFKFGYKTPGKF